MRNHWSLFIVVLLMAIGATAAHADTWTYTFQGAGPTPTTDWTLISNSGPLGYSGANLIGDLQSPADLYINGNYEGELTSVAFLDSDYIIMTAEGDFPISFAPNGYNPGSPGVYTDTSGDTLTVATPEPSCAALMLSGVGMLGLMMLMRKRSALGNLQAS